jgi:hypothetical protein
MNIKTMKRKRTAYRRHRDRRQKTRNRGGAKERATNAVLSAARNGAKSILNTASLGHLDVLQEARENDIALNSLKNDIKYIIVLIENCNRLLDYMYRKKIRCVKNTPVRTNSRVLVNRLVCNPQLEIHLRELMGELSQQLNELKIFDDELRLIIEGAVRKLNVDNGKRYAEVVKLVTRPSPSPPSPHALAGEGSPNESEDVSAARMQEAQIEYEHLKKAVELARILKNEHSTTRDPPPPPLVKVTESQSIFRAPQRKRVQVTLTEYMVETLHYSKSSGVTCETLLNEYIAHYVSEVAQPQRKQRSDFVHRLLGWYRIEVLKLQEQEQDHPIMLFERVNEGNNHKELLYLFYTFLQQFDDSILNGSSGPYMLLEDSAHTVKRNAMDAIIDMLRDRGEDTSNSVNLLLQAIVHPDRMQEALSSSEQYVERIINKAVGVGEKSRMDRIISAARGNLKTGLKKVATLKDAALTRSDMVTMQAAIQSTMVNLNTVYQSLLFQVMMVVNDEPRPFCSNDPLVI